MNAPSPRLLVSLALLPLFASIAPATTLDLDSNANAGIFPIPGGTWDFNHTVLWTPDGGATRLPWTSNDDTLRITLPGNTAWGDAALTVDSTHGPVGTHRIEITGTLPDWKYVNFNGDAFSLGAGGLWSSVANPNAPTYFRCPVTLTSSQTWITETRGTMGVGGTIRIEAPLSSDPDTTLTLEGLGMTDPSVVTLSNTLRPGFKFSSANALSGPLHLRHGAMLWIESPKNTTDNGPRLPLSAPLILEGSSVWLVGGVTTQTVSSILLRPGYSILRGNNASGSYRIGSIIREDPGATLDFPVAWNGGTTSTLEGGTPNTFLGGWATLNGGMWAIWGANNLVTGNAGTERVPSAWTDGVHIRAKKGGTRTGDVAPQSLHLNTNEPIDLGTSIITLQTGGLLASQQPITLLGGTLRSALPSGELFIHAHSAFTYSGTLAENDDIPGILVKGGPAALTLSGSFAFSGTTYLNGGTLTLSDSATLATPILQAGGSTLSATHGGTLAPPPSGWDLDGNLRLDDGATLALPLIPNAPAPIRLVNPYASLSQPTDAAISFRLSFPSNVEPLRTTYPLLSWAPEATAPTLNLDLLSAQLDPYVEGSFSLSNNTLSFTVTRIPPTATLLLVR